MLLTHPDEVTYAAELTASADGYEPDAADRYVYDWTD